MGKSKFLWALAGSLGLHSLIAISLWPRIPQRPAEAKTMLVHAQILSAPEKVNPARGATTNSAPKPETSPETHPANPLQPLAPSKTAPVDVHAPPSADSAGYLPIDAVDEAATPVGDWIVDTEVLPRGYTLRLVILVWISAGGAIDKWELDSQSGNKAYALKALVDLDRTVVRPAMRNNIAVPSYRRLEMVITHD